jgi:Na+-transporting NADH:ubiquinone oxidoreductase subunit B
MGGFSFGAVFMATDPVSSPLHKVSRLIYGLMIGMLCVVIRTVNPAYPEGMMLAILFINIFAPLIDHYVTIYKVNDRKRRYANE